MVSTMSLRSSTKANLTEDLTLLYLPKISKSVIRNISEQSQWVLYNNESERRRLLKRWAQMDKDHARQMRLLDAEFQEVKHDFRNMELEKKILMQRKKIPSRAEGSRSIRSGQSSGYPRDSAIRSRRGRHGTETRKDTGVRKPDRYLRSQEDTVANNDSGDNNGSELPVIQPKLPSVSNGDGIKSASKRILKSQPTSQDYLPISPSPVSDVSGNMSMTETIYYLSFQARERYLDRRRAGISVRQDEEATSMDDGGKSHGVAPSTTTREKFESHTDSKPDRWGLISHRVVDRTSVNEPKDNTPSWKKQDSEKRSKPHSPCGSCAQCLETMRLRRKSVMQQLYGQGRHIAERMEKRRLVSGSTAGWTAIRSVVIINNALKKSREKETIVTIPVS